MIRLKLSEKKALKDKMIEEFKTIKNSICEETLKRYDELPSEIRDSLMIAPPLLKGGLELSACHRIYWKLTKFIVFNNITDFDPLNSWAARKNWADVIYRTYCGSPLSLNVDGFHFPHVLFDSIEVDRFRALSRRSRARQAERAAKQALLDVSLAFLLKVRLLLE